MQQPKPSVPAGSGPWWKYGHMWLVLGGPAVVVVAAIATTVIAVRGADPVVDSDYYRKGLGINAQLRGNAASVAPAGAARNHVTTPARDLPDLRPQ